MRLDLYASYPHYADHLAPIWRELQLRPGALGAPYTLTEAQPWGTPLPDVRIAARAGTACLVAGWVDAGRLRPAGGRLIYVEHGAGQTYTGGPEVAADPSYSAGGDLADVDLFIVPNSTVAARRAATYPDTPVVVVGCPRLDRWHRRPPVIDRQVVAFTWHFDAGICPEAGTAWPHYRADFAHIVDALHRKGWVVLATAHPRQARFVRPQMEAAGAQWCSTDEVFDQAAILVGDNTSALPEFASTGRPVVFLNAPWYRRDVDHGGRFWSWPRGQVQVDDPGWVVDGIEHAWVDPLDARTSRAKMVEACYDFVDGFAAARAADAIGALLWENHDPPPR